jgi:hypothetical protein
VQVEALETFPVFNGGDTFIGDVLGEIEIKIGNAAQVLDLLHAAIGDMSQRKIKNTQGGIAIQAAEVGIGNPGPTQVDSGDEALTVARHGAAEGGDPLNIFACWSFATGRNCTEEDGEPKGFHWRILRLGKAESRSKTI